MEVYKLRRYMFSFYVDPDLGTLFEKLTTQIGAPLELGTQFHFEALHDHWIDIVEMEQSTSG